MRILILFLSLTYHSLFSQSIVFNEIVSSNNSTIYDFDGESSDWIEIFNNSTQDVNLQNYGLSDNIDSPFKWEFPDITIEAQNTLLIFASGKNTISNSEIHTNFKINSQGERLVLSNPNGVILDILQAIPLAEDQGYGRLPDGSANLITLDLVTPGSSNNQTGQIVFSKPAGLYDEGFYLHMKSLIGDTIYYTLDGSEPHPSTLLYQDSILIVDKSSAPNYFCEIPTSPDQSLMENQAWEAPSNTIDKATIIRSQSFRNGLPTSNISTQTYIVQNDIFSKYQLPIISLVTNESNLFDQNNGIYVPGIHYDENNPHWTGNYHQRGKDWERPIHIEYFKIDGKLGFSQNAGVRIHGGKTRIGAQKSFRFYAREEYGAKEFNYPIISNSDYPKYKKFILRTSMASWYDQSICKDVLTYEISNGLDFESQNYQPVIVYLNGEYWGIQTVREYLDENYISNKYKLNSDSIDLIEGNYNLVCAGSNQHYVNLIDFIENNDLSNLENYVHVLTQIDIESFIDYQIAEMFFVNKDWPGNNVKLWRPQTEDGKWRWIFYDLDAGLNRHDYNMFTYCTKNDPTISWPNPPYSTFLFRNLLKNSQFKTQFTDRFASLLNTTFATSSTILKANRVKNKYKNDIKLHSERWHCPDSYNSWENDLDEKLINFLENRPCAIQEQIIDFFNIGNFEFNCDNYNNAKRLFLAPNPNNGKFTVLNNSNETIRGEVLVTNLYGSISYHSGFVYLEGYETKEFDFSYLKSGIYLLNYRSSVNSETIKFVVIH